MSAKTTKQPSKSSSTPAVPADTVAVRGARRLRLPPPKLFRFKHITHPVKLPSAWQMARQAAAILWQRRQLFLGILAVYAVLSIIFVRGLSGGVDVGALRQQLGKGFGGNTGQLATGLSTVAALVAAAGNGASPASSAYQIILGLVVSLATIWALRQILAGERVGLRDTFYKGMYPLVPFVLVFGMVLLQLVPLLVGLALYGAATNAGIAVTVFEKLLFGAVMLVFALPTLYWLCSSLFGLYITTLPDMTPMGALRSARQLVRYRRWPIFRKLLFLPLILLVPGTVIMLPVIWFAAPAAPWALFILAMFCLIAAHAYMYTFYRELLRS